MQPVVAEQGRFESGGGHCWHWCGATAGPEHRVGRPGETLARKGERWKEALTPQMEKIRKATEKKKAPAPSPAPVLGTH